MNVKFRFEFKLQDLWLGVFWKRSEEQYFVEAKKFFTATRVDIWICLLPCFPLHIVNVGEPVETDLDALLYEERQLEVDEQ